MTGVGIDLGTTFSSIAIFHENQNQPSIIQFGDKRSIPSVVGFIDEDIIVGQIAKDHKAEYENQVIYDTKRALGKKFNDPVVQDDKKSWPFKISADKDGFVQYDISPDGKTLEHKTPEAIASIILSHLMTKMNGTLAKKVNHAVITIPTAFDTLQREKIKLAAEAAGIRVVSFLPESSAAAVAYGLLNNSEQKLLIFDFGGGTLDVSIIEINKNNEIKELATAGDSHLGGRNIDNNLVEYVFHELEKRDKNYRNNKKALCLIQDACESAKIALSAPKCVRTSILFTLDNESYNFEIKRSQFNKINQEIFGNKIIDPVKEALRIAKLEINQITDILAVGGSSHIPAVRDALSEFFEDRELLDPDIVTDEAIAIGAAIYCKNILDEDVTPPKPIKTPLEPVTPAPAYRQSPPSRTGGMIALKVINKVPHTICTPYVYGDYETIFAKGSNMPNTHVIKSSLAFTEYRQEAVTIEICESNDDARNPQCNLIKRYTFTLPKDVHGKQEGTIETYHIDAAGNLSVDFKFKLSGKEYKGNISKDDLFHTTEQFNRMRQDVARLQKQEMINL